jgi:hypothetical protein
MKIVACIIFIVLVGIIVFMAVTLETEEQQGRLRRPKQVRRRRLPNPPRQQQLLLPSTTLKQQEAEQQRQQQEQKRQEQKAARHVREALKRQEAESQRSAAAKAAAAAARAAAEERARAEQVLSQWKQERGATLSTPEQTSAVIDETHRARLHCGDFIHVLVLTDETGVALEWQVRPDTWFCPTVVGIRDGEEMFTAKGYTGRHAARLVPGRYMLTFHLWNDDTPMNDHHDVRFEVFVPDPNSSPNIPGFQKVIDRVAQRFVARAKAIDDGRRKVKQALTDRGADTDEVDYEAAKFDAEISDLQNPN